MRYAYGITTALLLGGSLLTLTHGLPAGAQVAQNEAQQVQSVVPRAGAPASFADLTQQLAPAVVNISTRQKVQVGGGNPFAGTPFEGMFGGGGQGPQTREAQSQGSGFVISADGFVVTNNHVITMDGQGVAESVKVKFPDGSEYTAKVVGRDAATDLAVLKINAGKPLPFVKFGESAKARAGDWVIAIGNPFGLGGTVTSGIISSVNRVTGSGAYDHYIQTDASINSGNSGGPMFDMAGNVLGINTWIIAPSGGNVGIGFAIPSDIAKPIVEKLKGGQAIERGYLGIRIQPLAGDLAESIGVPQNRGEFVQGVEPGQGAAKAGLKAGDVVMKVAGKDVTPDQSLSSIVANTAPGTKISVELIRDGNRMTVNAIVGKRPSEEELAQQQFGQEQPNRPATPPSQQAGSELAAKALGLSVLPLTEQIARQLGVSEDLRGLVIGGVDQSSDASTKGLQRGDIILSANYRDIATVPELEGVINTAKRDNRAAVLLRVQRRGQPAAYIPVRMR